MVPAALASQRACGVAGAKRFGGVLNQNQLVAAGNVQQAGHIGHIAKHMHHAQRAHAGTGFVIVQPVLFQGAVVGTKNPPRRPGQCKGYRCSR